MTARGTRCIMGLLAVAFCATPASSQDHSHHARPDTVAKAAPPNRPRATPRTSARPLPSRAPGHASHSRAMTGMYGPYAIAREASGTAWQPDLADHHGVHAMRGSWMLMVHGTGHLGYVDHQGPRGDRKYYSDNMGMGMAQRAWGPGTLGVRAMLSAEPATIGREGYPLLLQTGETADGVTHLIDRQHPHDLFMELSASYRVARGNRSLFVYGGLPGEPALGPPAFMHRFSGAHLPVAPITHHWLDSSHITFGVLTAGVVMDRCKIEVSAFRGREPDQRRWNIESPRLDSHALRLSFNPTAAWALQVSHGRLESPEQLEPEVVQVRSTASAMVVGAWNGWHWEGTLAWGRNRNRPGRTLDGVLAEAAARRGDRHTWFVRGERVHKDELFPDTDPRAGHAFHVGEWSGGYRCDFLRQPHIVVGVGGLAGVSLVPRALRDAYGASPATGMLFLRAALR